MKKNIRVSEPSPEMQEKIRRARCAIVNQKMRMVKCPYCGHNAIAVLRGFPWSHTGQVQSLWPGKPYLM